MVPLYRFLRFTEHGLGARGDSGLEKGSRELSQPASLTKAYPMTPSRLESSVGDFPDSSVPKGTESRRMNADDKISEGVRMLQGQGHRVELRNEFGKMWWEIEHWVPASPEEIEHLVDGVYSLDELQELYIKRRREERAGYEH